MGRLCVCVDRTRTYPVAFNGIICHILAKQCVAKSICFAKLSGTGNLEDARLLSARGNALHAKNANLIRLVFILNLT